MVEPQSSKLITRVRFSSPALQIPHGIGVAGVAHSLRSRSGGRLFKPVFLRGSEGRAPGRCRVPIDAAVTSPPSHCYGYWQKCRHRPPRRSSRSATNWLSSCGQLWKVTDGAPTRVAGRSAGQSPSRAVHPQAPHVTWGSPLRSQTLTRSPTLALSTGVPQRRQVGAVGRPNAECGCTVALRSTPICGGRSTLAVLGPVTTERHRRPGLHAPRPNSPNAPLSSGESTMIRSASNHSVRSSTSMRRCSGVEASRRTTMNALSACHLVCSRAPTHQR
jgi:hypothetical protein